MGSPLVLSFTIPDQIKSILGQEDVNRQGYPDYADASNGFVGFNEDIDRTIGEFEIPENILEVAAVGFVAGLAGSLFGMSSATTTTPTTTTATTSTTTTTTTTTSTTTTTTTAAPGK